MPYLRTPSGDIVAVAPIQLPSNATAYMRRLLFIRGCSPGTVVYAFPTDTDGYSGWTEVEWRDAN